jgi:soluble lytic murein transglycosylase-like protein
MKTMFLIIPAGVILAAALGATLEHRLGRYANAPPPKAAAEASVPYPVSWSARENASYAADILESLGQPDRILTYYRSEANRCEVLAFFSALTQSEEIAASILDSADRFDIPPALAFALCWGESRFNPWAVNRANRNRTTDRGLFQLNNESFPTLKEADFFDPRVNAYYGMAHLRWCLDSGGSEVAGLAMYNAGTNRVKEGATPRLTLDHVSRILEFRNGIEELFQIEYVRSIPSRHGETLIATSPR